MEARADLRTWHLFLEHIKGNALFPSNIVHSSASLHLFTNASNLGFGGTFDNKWFWGEFSSEWLSHHISVREFLPIVIAFELWGSCLANIPIVIHSDNAAVVHGHVINKKNLNRHQTYASDETTNDFVFISEHTLSSRTYTWYCKTAANLLSRLQVQEFMTRFPHMDKEPTQVPQSLINI